MLDSQIRNARGEMLGQVPRGSPGVVGETPVLIPGHGSFVYSSSAEIDTPTGSMQVRAHKILRLKTIVRKEVSC